MPKIHIRYPAKADVPPEFAQFYTPVDQTKPEGPQRWDGFESDPEGWAVTQVSKTQGELERLRKDKQRADEKLRGFRKPDSEDELWSPAEIEELVQKAANLAELQGKEVDVDALRKQVAEELGGQFKGKETQLRTALESAQGESKYYRDKYAEKIRITEAVAALQGLNPKKGLHDIAIERFSRDLDLEEFDLEDGRKDFRVRVKGPNGHRIDANGNPIGPSDYAKGEFAKSYAELFEPTDARTGTGAAGSGGGGGGKGPGGGDGKGSGRFQLAMKDVMGNTSLLREMQKKAPNTDFVQILDAEGGIQDVRPGLREA